MAKTKYYVVWEGKKPGIYTDWESCRKQVQGQKGAKYKSFTSRQQAEAAFEQGADAALAAGKKNAPTKKKSPVGTLSREDVAKLTSDTLIYTDGGCEPNPGEAGSGLAIYRNKKVDALWYGCYQPMGTNNTAELNALYQGLLIARDEIKDSRSVSVLCDSKYSIQCVTVWAHGWKKNGWTRPNGEIKNLALIQSLFDLYESIKTKVKVLHVNGHVGIEGNELADRMTMLAIDKQCEDFCLYNDPIDIDQLLAMRTG